MSVSRNDVLTEISGKLDRILKLLAIDAVKGYSTEKEKIELLDSLGFRPLEIARFLNKSPDNVSVQLNIIRKKKRGTQRTAVNTETNNSNVEKTKSEKVGDENEFPR